MGPSFGKMRESHFFILMDNTPSMTKKENIFISQSFLKLMTVMSSLGLQGSSVDSIADCHPDDQGLNLSVGKLWNRF